MSETIDRQYILNKYPNLDLYRSKIERICGEQDLTASVIKGLHTEKPLSYDSFIERLAEAKDYAVDSVNMNSVVFGEVEVKVLGDKKGIKLVFVDVCPESDEQVIEKLALYEKRRRAQRNNYKTQDKLNEEVKRLSKSNF